MPGHDPAVVADLIRAKLDLQREGAELLRFVGNKAPVYFGIGGDDVLVCDSGWDEARDPADYLRIVPSYR